MENSDVGASQAPDSGTGGPAAPCQLATREGEGGRGEENSRQRVGLRQVVDEAGAQGKNCNTRER